MGTRELVRAGISVRKVLIITFHFSRKERVASIRLRGLAKYLPEFGWEPTIVTAKQPNSINQESTSQNLCRLIETDYQDINAYLASFFGINPDKPIRESLNIKSVKNKNTLFDRTWGLVKELLYYPDREKGWYKYGLEAGKEILEEDNYDAIISSSFPVTAHLIARELKLHYNIPWIADLRDLWTQNHYYPYSSFRKMIDTRLEKKTLGLADALTTVSGPLNEALSGRYPDKYTSTITNGFDPEETNPGVPLSKGFTITYTGQLYRGRQDPEPLLKALSELIHDGVVERGDVSIDFYGKYESWLEEDVTRYKLGDVVTLHGPVSREVAIRKQWESQILLLLTWNDPAEQGVYTGKVFDYLAARRPILSLGLSGGVVTRLIDDTNAGVHVSTEEEIKSYLLAAYKEFKKNGAVHYSGNQSEIDKYSHYEMARKFAEVLNAIT